MLSDRYDDETLLRTLIPRDQFRPYPTFGDQTWDALPADLKAGKIAAGEAFLNHEWPSLPATLFMQYQREGNRSRYEAVHFARRNALTTLVLAECLERQGRFLDDITNGIWQTCEESFWGIPAHNTQLRFTNAALPDTTDRYVDLFVSETAALLAWTDYLLHDSLDSVSVLIGERLRREVQERVTNPFLARNDFWWMGLDTNDPHHQVNNWNPWCNGNCLCAALLLETDEERRRSVVSKVMLSLERFFDAYYSDGGCDEGPSYWGRAGGSLFDCLDLLHAATNGAIDIFDEPLVQNIGSYLYRAHISGDYYVNFADGGARVASPANLVYRYGKRIGDDKLAALGIYTFHQQKTDSAYAPLREPLLRTLPMLFDYTTMDATSVAPPLVRDAWLDGIQMMTAREKDGSDSGFYLAAKGGHNAESHNHNDVGQFLVYRDGKPILIDVGVETYSAKTFNAHRYEIWTMQSVYHNLPTIGEIQQLPGESYRARDVTYSANETSAQLSQDIAEAYPAEAGIVSWHRTVQLQRPGNNPGSVLLRDTFSLRTSAEVTLSLMTPCTPDLTEAGILRLTDDTGITTDITYPSNSLTATSERIAIDDARLRGSWGDHLYRILLKTTRPVLSGDWELGVIAKESSLNGN